MRFFEHQDSSRKKTAWLLVFFVFGLTGIVLSLNLLVVLLLAYSSDGSGSIWQPDLFLIVTLGASVVIILGSVVKIFRLRQGGSYIAERLGGRPISHLTPDPKEKVFINIVEEMSLASGVPMPAVYVLDNEQGINAFAAGYSPDDAAVAVTKGCLEQLNRDELQGVIGHEFSHILNGDMNLNIKLMGVLGGIVLLATIGQHLLEWSHRVTYRSSDKRANLLPLLGLALIVVGYTGLLFGRLIKSAISRQREFLADASAVQFTRNPDGIASALKKIGGLSRGSFIRSPLAEEASHMFFSNALKANFFASHPPLEERIHRLDPSFTSQANAAPATAAASATRAGLAGFSPGTPSSPEPEPEPAPPSLTLSKFLRNNLTTPYSSTLTVLALFLPADPTPAKEGIERVVQRHLIKLTEARTDLTHSYQAIQQVAPEYRPALLNLARPVLVALSPRQKAGILAAVQTLINSETRLFTFSLQKILESTLHPPPTDGQVQDIKQVLPDLGLILSLVAHASGRPQAAWPKALAVLHINIKLIPLDNISLPAVETALNRLKELSPALQKQCMAACLACVQQDVPLNEDLAALLSALAHTMNSPLPSCLPQLA